MNNLNRDDVIAAIDSAKGRAITLEDNLKIEKHKLNRLQIDLVTIDYGIKVGSVVKDKQGHEYKVSSIDVTFGGDPWVKGCKRKKDGEFGVREQHLFDYWELV